MGKFDHLRNLKILSGDDGKYKLGKNSDSFETVRHLKPVFAFDYICDDSSEFSFTGNQMGAREYQRLMANLKRISNETYESLNKNYMFHFHEVKWKEVTVKESDFNKCVYGSCNNNGELTPYQVKLFEGVRAIGFLYRGVFYLVMLDVGHNAYKRK